MFFLPRIFFSKVVKRRHEKSFHPTVCLETARKTVSLRKFARTSRVSCDNVLIRHESKLEVLVRRVVNMRTSMGEELRGNDCLATWQCGIKGHK